MYDSFKYVTASQNIEKVISNITSKLETKVAEVTTVLDQTKNIIEKYFYSNGRRNLNSAVFECWKTTNVLSEYEIYQPKGVLNNSYSEENFTVDLGK